MLVLFTSCFLGFFNSNEYLWYSLLIMKIYSFLFLFLQVVYIKGLLVLNINSFVTEIILKFVVSENLMFFYYHHHHQHHHCAHVFSPCCGLQCIFIFQKRTVTIFKSDCFRYTSKTILKIIVTKSGRQV